MNKYIPIDTDISESLNGNDKLGEDSILKSINIIEKLLRKTLEKVKKKKKY